MGPLTLISDGFVAKSRLRSKATEIGAKRNKEQEMHIDRDDFMFMGTDAHSKLIAHIRKRAHPFQRPVVYSHTAIDIHVRAALYQIVDLDQRNNLATLSSYFDVSWIDTLIRWNASEFDAALIEAIFSMQGRIPDYAPDATAEINDNGRLRMFIPVTSRALCPINVKYFPFDTQNCTFAVSLGDIK
ncbi:unnamed protein product [Toxocara canis]|uniref:Neur_chan_LBD domain-containing protein n=1 Tax=Toxocara canis TaxID=6265 RepID=A0A183VCD4_TOXCA|nr:unnamed protein product [Toxocara canis]